MEIKTEAIETKINVEQKLDDNEINKQQPEIKVLTKSQRARARKLAKKKAEKELKNGTNSEIKSESLEANEVTTEQNGTAVAIKREASEDTSGISNEKQPKKQKTNQKVNFNC